MFPGTSEVLVSFRFACAPGGAADFACTPKFPAFCLHLCVPIALRWPALLAGFVALYCHSYFRWYLVRALPTTWFCTVLLRRCAMYLLFTVLLRLPCVDCCKVSTACCSIGLPFHSTSWPIRSFHLASFGKILPALNVGRGFPNGELKDSADK